MNKNYQIATNITHIDCALLHGDGSTFKEELNINPMSFKSEHITGFMSYSLFDFKMNSVNSIIQLWNTLPASEPMRCFSPGYRLEFYNEASLYLRAAICWDCNLIELEMDNLNKPIRCNFDGESDQAKKLISKIRESCSSKIHSEK